MVNPKQHFPINIEMIAAISSETAQSIRSDNDRLAQLSEDKAAKIQKSIRRFTTSTIDIAPVSDSLPEINIIVGPSASGKSTLAHGLINSFVSESIRHIPYLEYSHAVVEDGVCLCGKDDVIVFESILCSKEQRERFQEIRKVGLYVRMFFIFTEDPFINVLRATKQALLKGKKCEAKKICERYYKSLAAAIALLPYANELCVFDNSIDNRPPELVLQIDENGTILYRSRNIPEWALLFLNSNTYDNETTSR